MSVLLQNKTNHTKYMVLGVLCGSWSCSTCGPYLVRKWTEHLTDKIMSSAETYVSLVGKARWDTVSKRVQRAKGQYAIIEQRDGIIVAFTTVSVGGESVSKATALSRLDKAIKNAASRRPVHTSRGWSLPKTASGASEWERVRSLPVAVDEAERVIKAAGISTSAFFTPQQTGFVLTLPTSADSDNDFKQLLELLTKEQERGDSQ